MIHSSTSLGTHCLVDLFDCNLDKLNDLSFLRRSFIEIAKAGNATVVSEHFHTFNPIGISGVLVIAESHIALHTWPEHRIAALDIFSCSPNLDIRFIVEGIAKCLEAKSQASHLVLRGQQQKRHQPTDIHCNL